MNMNINIKILLVLALIFTSDTFSANTPEMQVAGKGVLLASRTIPEKIVCDDGTTFRNAAGLLIESEMENLTYNSYNGIIKIDKNPDQDLLYLTPEEQVVEVFQPGYKPLKIILSDYGIALKSSKIWQLKLVGYEIQQEIPVNFVIKPEGAAIKIDDENKGQSQNQMVTPGYHKLSIEMNGYKPIVEMIKVQKENETFNFKLEKLFKEIQVQLSTSPTEALVSIDDEFQGTKRNFLLTKGSHKIKIESDGYETLVETVTVSERTKTWRFTLKEFLHNVPTKYELEMTLDIEKSPTDYLKYHFNTAYGWKTLFAVNMLPKSNLFLETYFALAIGTYDYWNDDIFFGQENDEYFIWKLGLGLCKKFNVMDGFFATKLGYQFKSMDFTPFESQIDYNFSTNGLYFGVGVEIPFNEKYHFGIDYFYHKNQDYDADDGTSLNASNSVISIFGKMCFR